MRYRTGHIADPAGHRRTPFHHLAARLAIAAIDSPSLEQFLSEPLDQGATSSCTGHAFGEGTYVALGASGAPLPWIPSPGDLYRLARCIDRFPRPDGSLAPLTDDGAQPSQVLRALSEWGVRPMRRLPDRMSDADPRTINDEPKLDELEEDGATLLVGGYGIYSTGKQRGQDVRLSLSILVPVTVAVPGGSDAWQSYTGGIIGPTGTPIDHDAVVYRAELQPDGSYIYFVRNSWGWWGEGGSCRVSEAALDEFEDIVALSVRRAS